MEEGEIKEEIDWSSLSTQFRTFINEQMALRPAIGTAMENMKEQFTVAIAKVRSRAEKENTLTEGAVEIEASKPGATCHIGGPVRYFRRLVNG